MSFAFNPFTGTLDDAGQSKTGQIIVRSAAQLSGALLSDKVYFIDAVIDMGSTTIDVPEGGLTIEGHGYDISKLYSTANNYTMFTYSGTYSGNLTLNNNTIYVTGTSSQIFDIDNKDNFGALELNTINLGDFGKTTPSFGTIKGYRQFRTANNAFISYTEGFIFDGTMNGLALNDSIGLSIKAGSTLLRAGGTLNITGGFSSNMNMLSATGTAEFCDFADTNFATGAVMSLTNFRTNADDAVPNISSKNIKALFRSCVGVDNTFIGASWTLTTEAQTNITVNKTLVKMAGTTTADLDAHFTMPANNRLQYNGEKTIKVDIIGYLQLSSTNTDSFEVEARQWDGSASAWIDLRTLPIETALKILGDRRGGGTVVANALLETGDYIELWALDASAAGTADPTMELESTITVSERQS